MHILLHADATVLSLYPLRPVTLDVLPMHRQDRAQLRIQTNFEQVLLSVLVPAQEQGDDLSGFGVLLMPPGKKSPEAAQRCI